MDSISRSLTFFLNLTVTQSVIARKFDVRLSVHSISLSDFMILLHLSQSPEQKLRRIDLAEKAGLSASAVAPKLARWKKSVWLNVKPMKEMLASVL